MVDSKIKKFIPKELLKSSSSVKLIVPTKGSISSKDAFVLENLISMQIELNNANAKKQFLNIKKKGEF